MNLFEEICEQEQVSLLKKLGQKALEAYSFSKFERIELSLLEHRYNTTFRVEVFPPSHVLSPIERTYALRIYRQGLEDPRFVWSELVWLKSLYADAGLIVPRPITTSNGCLMTTTHTSRLQEPRYCALFSWLEGEFLGTNLDLELLQKAGVFMGRLHQHSSKFIPPPGFTRNKWGYRELRKSVKEHKYNTPLTAAYWNSIDLMAEKALDTMKVLGEHVGIFGLIHADLHQFNYLVDKNMVGAIDFDTLAWGYYLYDIAAAFSKLYRLEDFSRMKAAFLNGYRSIYTLLPEHEELIEIFMGIQNLSKTLWLMSLLDKPRFNALSRIEQQVQDMHLFL